MLEKLSGLDRSFLALESPSAHMHLGATLVFAGGSLVDAQGRVDLERIRDYAASRLHLLGRYRKHLAQMPLGPDLLWVDDPDFDLRRHVLGAQLPAPGGEPELKELAARVASEPLDHSRPLWQLWVVSGLGAGRFALIIKTHHCLNDGIAAVDLLTALLMPQIVEKVEAPRPWSPEPAPAALRLWATALRDGAGRQLGALRALRSALRPAGAIEAALRENFEAVGQTLAGVRPTSRTRLNRSIGPGRRVEWFALDLADLSALRARLGGTLNDAVLAVTSGALRRYLEAHGENVAALDLRALVPVSVREPGARRGMGNRIALWLVDLPVEEADARLRHEQVRAVTRGLKRSSQTLGAATLAEVTAWTSTAALARIARLIPYTRPFNLLVTNVPGPPIPLWLLDAELEAAYPLAPLFRDQALAIALFSYGSRLHVGLVADREGMPDLARFRDALLESFDELRGVGASAG